MVRVVYSRECPPQPRRKKKNVETHRGRVTGVRAADRGLAAAGLRGGRVQAADGHAARVVRAAVRAAHGRRRRFHVQRRGQDHGVRARRHGRHHVAPQGPGRDQRDGDGRPARRRRPGGPAGVPGRRRAARDPVERERRGPPHVPGHRVVRRQDPRRLHRFVRELLRRGRRDQVSG